MDVFVEILKLVDKNGPKGTLYVAFLFALILILILSFKYLWVRIKKPIKKQGNLTQEDLLNHHMFGSLKTYLSYEIQHLNIRERLRNAIFKDFLIYKFSSIRHEFEYFLKKGDLEKMSSSIFHARMLESINNIVKKYEEKALQEGIPSIVILKFNDWHQDRIKQMYQVIDDVCSDDIYNTNTLRTKIIFDYVLVIINWTIADAKKTLISLNGELNKITYKGISIDPEYLKK